ncbi:hypothetical protein CONLIGDRAFT_522284 [Coniochaeta ligniaria NRRL 30616]|uniref:Uncharacterized protein n=1 Tax=Coniochaeta ligniaria NRRL 30616 TaxID=1408157 RepID=A0A1J7IER0_9PEZI|nr:hypothetical protein CONLIGDRAFT_522284 [Coniochaeta ligniaria NRRL 30616]
MTRVPSHSPLLDFITHIHATSITFGDTPSSSLTVIMAPIRRYLRITKYSVLECRIYLDNPALAQSWLLNPRDPVLPRVIESVRPLVLPKLREEKERERSRKKGAKKKNIKDVVTSDDFEVSIFLTETNTRHSLLYKHKHFRDKTQTKLTSNSTKLSGASLEAPINVDGGEELYDGLDSPVLRREDSDENEAIVLDDIPTMAETEAETESDAVATRRSKRRRSPAQPPPANGGEEVDSDQGVDDDYAPVDAFQPELSDDEDEDGESDELFVDNRPSKRRKDKETENDTEPEPADDKKKMAMDISYEGFAIYGRVLCLVVKRRGSGRGAQTTASNKSQMASQLANQAVMDNWITSTQMPVAEPVDDMEA